MGVANAFVSVVLRSPLHRLISGSIDLVRYTGRRTGRVITTPTQYAVAGDDVVIVVGRPSAKTWWRNFVEERELDVHVRGTWRRMLGVAVDVAESPAVGRPLLDAYRARFPKVRVGDDAVVVWCRPIA
jgi:hypothetical protein